MTECKIETCPTTGTTIYQTLKDSSLGTSLKHIAPNINLAVQNGYVPDCGINDIPFIDEEVNENVDLMQR